MTKRAGTESNHWPLLDFLRAAAALLVLFGHTRNWIFLNIGAVEHPGLLLRLFYFVTVLQHEAVVIFFVLSGFLIGGRLADSVRQGSFDLAHYLISRFVRIYIVYVPALIVTEGIFFFGSILLSDPGYGHIRPLFNERQIALGGFQQAFCHIAGLQGFSCAAWDQNPPLWSLGYEWALYLIAPAIIQLIVWKAAAALRVMAIVLVCALVISICDDPGEVVFWFAAWFLGAVSYCVLRTSAIPLPAGLLGAFMIIAGMAVSRLKIVNMLETDMIIAAGAAIMIACRQMIAFPLAPRFFGWAAGFSYTLYAIHLPIVFLIVAIFQNIGFPTDKVPPGPLAFMEFLVTIIICLLSAFLVSLVTERKTAQVRAALFNMCSRRKRMEGQTIWTKGGT